jgi:hypothetical protein
LVEYLFNPDSAKELHMAKPRKVYPLSAVRAMALHAQGLSAALPKRKKVTLDMLEHAIDQVVCVQIDTLQMVHRSQYLALWSRVGHYDPKDLDRLVFGAAAAKRNERRMFEYWLKEACIIPLKDYRYSLPLKRWRREENRQWWQRWLTDQINSQVLDVVRQRIGDEGGLRAADFEHKRNGRGSWWDWKPAKIALEHLYNTGEVMIANRVNFQRVYDHAERVLPAWVDRTEPTMDERHRYYIERSVRALGICQPMQAADYTHTRRNEVKSVVHDMIAAGVLLKVQAELSDGHHHELVVHPDDLPTLEQAADGALVPTRTTFLSPFDSLFWGLRRDMQLFNFRQILECYKPEPQRVWGYFCLPILHRDRVVGRLDPKLERKDGTLRIKALYLEPGVEPDDELATSVAGALRDFMRFHAASEVVIEKSVPDTFGGKVMGRL